LYVELNEVGEGSDVRLLYVAQTTLEARHPNHNFILFFWVWWLLIDAGASPTHQESQHIKQRPAGQATPILKMLWDCCADLK
jgi:hypothetical protein